MYTHTHSFTFSSSSFLSHSLSPLSSLSLLHITHIRSLSRIKNRVGTYPNNVNEVKEKCLKDFEKRLKMKKIAVKDYKLVRPSAFKKIPITQVRNFACFLLNTLLEVL
jgi:hypothetical protein